MNSTSIRTCSALAAALLGASASLAADIRYVADNVSGEYNGAAYGIAETIAVSTPSGGATVKYATSASGPWQDAPVTFKDVCTAKPIYFQISAEGYETVVDSRTVTVTPKALTGDYVWLVLPTEDYVYDGAAKTPDVAFGDGDPSILTRGDFDVSYASNTNAGTATATFTGKGNYAGTVTEEFDILKADNEWTTAPAIAGWTYGQTPSAPTSAAKSGTATVTYGASGTTRPTLPGSYTATFTIPESANYKALTATVDFTVSPATIRYVADDVSGEYYGAAYGIAETIAVSTPSGGATVKYATSASGPWQDAPVTFKDVCTAKPIYFQISAEGYETVVDSRTVTVTPKALTGDYVWLVLPTEDYVYDGAAKAPDVAFGDGDPSILTRDDFDVSYASNTNAGTAKAIFTGKRNYTGSVEAEFDILARPLAIVADAKSKTYNTDDPPLTYTAAGLVGNDAISGALAREPGDAVGTYAILQGSLDAGDNYDIDYTGATFTITKAPFPGDGEEPGDGTVPQGGESKFDATSVYDGQGHTIDTNALVAAFGALLGEDFQVSYAADDPNVQVDARQWAPSAPAYTNVGEYTLWYRVTPTNYEDFAHKAKVTITPRPVNVAADPQTKRRGENDPPLTYTADPLIAGDSFSGNLERESGETNGVYAITISSLTAGDNYEIAFTGASLTISDDVPQLPGATLRWKFAASVGRYFAQVSIPAQAGYSESLGNLAFLFADRKSADGTIYAQLWDLPSRGPCEVVVTDNGVEYRGVALDASAFAGKADGTPVVFGVSDDTFAESRNIVPSKERLIGLYVRKRVNPVSGNETDGEVENFIGYLSWTTGGTRYFLPVVEGAANGEVSTLARRSSLAHSSLSFAAMPHAYAPATLGLSVSLGLDAIAVANDSPKARISAFEVGADGSVRGRVEAVAGGEASSSFGSSATVVVFASETPAGPWREVHAEVDSAIGAFSLPAGTVTGHFFRAEVETKPIFE